MPGCGQATAQAVGIGLNPAYAAGADRVRVDVSLLAGSDDARV